MNAPKACMGGGCGRREGCQNYHAADRRNPAERLCVPGVDGTLRDSLRPEPRATLACLIAQAAALGEPA